MTKLSFKQIIILVVFLIYLGFTIILFMIFNQSFLERIKKNLVAENKYSTEVIKGVIEEEKKNAADDARIVTSDDKVYHAFYSNIYLYAKKGVRIKNKFIKVSKMNKLRYINLVISMAQKIGKGSNMSSYIEKNIELFDINQKLIVKTPNLLEKYVDTGKENYIERYYEKSLNFLEMEAMGVIVEKEDKFFIKGIDRVFQTTSVGVVVVTKEINNDFVDKLKKIINKDVFIIKNNKIHISTFQKYEVKDIVIDKLEKENKIYYRELTIGEKEVGISFFPIYDNNNKVIMYFGSSVNLGLVEELFKEVKKKFIPIEIALSLIVFIILYLLLQKLFKPFEKIVKVIKEIGEGNYNKEIEIEERKEIKVIIESIKSMAGAINQREEELKIWNEKLDKEVIRKTSSISNLLNNAGQGFLSFDNDLIINEEYSLECKNIFNQKISGIKIIDLISDNEESKKGLEKAINLIFDKERMKEKEILISLLPDKLEVNNKYIKLDYRYIRFEDHDQIMMILTDITKNKRLENKIEKERKNLHMILKVITDKLGFNDLIADYRVFTEKIENLDKKNDLKSTEEIFEIYRNIHTFKGSFAHFYMKNTEEFFNGLENSIVDIIKLDFNILRENLFVIFAELKFDNILKKDFEIIKRFIGDDYLTDKKLINIEESKIIEIEKMMFDQLSKDELDFLIPKIRKLRYTSFQSLMFGYEEYTFRIANKLNKKINKVNITGGDFLIDSNKFMKFVKTLGHVFRNMVDHGIESSDERVSKGKDVLGNINCKINLEDNYIYIEISDDGQGIRTDKIMERLLKFNNIKLVDLENMSDEKLISYIFKDKFSTKDNVGDLSGRGEGLAAVKHELSLLRGEVIVESKLDLGTKFTFKIPYSEDEENTLISNQKILDILKVKLLEYLKDEIQIGEISEKSYEKTDIVNLYKYSTIIELKGAYKSSITLSVENELAKFLASKLFIEDIINIKEEEISDVITEILNIIIGNSSEEFDDKYNIDISNFYVYEQLLGNNLTIINKNTEVLGYDINTNKGKLCFFIEKKRY